MDSHLANLLRRSRQPHQRAAAANLKSSLEKKSLEHALDRRLTPEQLSAIQAANSRAAATTPAAAATTASAARTTNPATPATAATEAVGGVASRIQSSSAVTSSAVVRSSTVNDISPAMPASSAVTSSSAVPSSSTRVVTSSSTVRSTSSVAPSSSSTRPATLTVTSTRALSSASSSLSASSTLPTVSAAAASQSSESTGLGTGPIVGIALAVVVGVVVVGSCIGWCYRKHAQRKYSDKAPWAKLDDNVTPYPQDNEKSYHPDDDIYGQSQAPVIGSRRALALARQNGFNADGSMRPDSDYMMQRGDNNAGFGAGRGLGHQYGAYPTMDQSQGYNQNQDYDQNQDYHYGHEQGPRSPAYDYGSAQTGMAISAPGNTRQLVGSNGAPHGYPMPAPLAPVALGRPLPPQSAAEFADREEFMELPKPTPTNSSGNHMSQYSTYGLAYADSEPEYMPHTATTTGWAADSKTQHTPLPVIEPASPLMSSFDFQKRQSLGPIASNFATKYGAGSNTLPNYHDEDEHSRQKRMYGEVAFAAGVMEPTTPHTADLSSSTNSYESASSFSTHQQSEPRSISHRLPPAPMPALPTVNVLPPQPYQHGRPLSPLTEVETPRSMALTSSSVLHGQELNPFEHALHPPTHQSGFRPPYSASSSTGATAFPSPSFPPPSPGGMSVPGSVTDSPRKRESMFDVDDAYGGI